MPVIVHAATVEDRLSHYRRLRDFAATPEPSGSVPALPAPGGAPRFVVQQHDATRLHWDLRLEREGVLASWALPRGFPWRPKENRLAVHTEDHPLDYLEFHGEIPAGQYGAGTMTIWDRGTYEAHTFAEDKVVVSLHGERVQGTYALFPIGEREWMIHRVDPPQDPHRRPVPDDLRPMVAVAGDLPSEAEDWAFEVLWSGARVLVTNDAGRITLSDAQGRDVSEMFPELRRMGRSLGAVDVILDGVVVAVDARGQPLADAANVERRLASRDERQARRLAEDRPVAAMLFDLLWLEGHPTTDLTYIDRRSLLSDLELAGPAWQTPANHRGDGEALLQVARAQGLRGLVAKRLDSTYRPGETTTDWRVL
ncbi:MAG: ATP-dependent DNA ligase [Actinomycetota bacterium]|nr:ATP-dependent DNA ligase [Actinomycetota bacterium]